MKKYINPEIEVVEVNASKRCASASTLCVWEAKANTSTVIRTSPTATSSASA